MPPEFEIPINTEAIKDVLINSAKIVNQLYKAGTTVVHKVDGSPLTQVDRGVEEFLKSSLTALFPEAGWLSEETADNPDRLAKDWAWVVDPLDGTIEFTQGIPEFAISVGLVFRQKSVMGGVINPATGEAGLGVVGGKAEFWGGLKQRPTAGKLSDACAIISRTETEDGSVFPVIHLVAESYPVGSVAYKLLRVAAGHDHLTISVQHKSEWDICGGVALLNAAGKEYCRFDGKPVKFNQKHTRIRSGAAAGDAEIVDQFLTAMDSNPNNLPRNVG